MKSSKLYKEIKRIILAFGYSIEGLKAALGEAAFRIELIIAIIALPISFMVTHNTAERALLIGSLFLVMIVELLNTAVEIAINRISLETHPLSKKAKDVASGAVFLSIINAIAIWLVILWN
ncbi:MAG: diacylglycerol kinase [Rickettsiales bacterium]|jgi:diacylglycerol kinase (ATP)